MKPAYYRIAGIVPLAISAVLAAATIARSAEGPSPSEVSPRQHGVAGGLCVQLGCEDPAAVMELARTGRFLVQVVESDEAELVKLRDSLQPEGLYGLVSAVKLPSGASRLPYAENLVNLLVVTGRGPGVPPSEMMRVLSPGGTVAIRGGATVDALRSAGFEGVSLQEQRGGWVVGRKPWPAEMDQWTHPRHAADGNAVSRDALVGPPRRIRWIEGPSAEVSNMVTTEGRNFYGGVWTRDAFNGLRLWQRDLNPSPARGAYSFHYAPGSVRPVAAGDLLFVATDGKVLALDAAGGGTVREYPEAGKPSELLHVDGTLLAIDGQSVRALDVDSAALVWKYQTSGPRYVVADDRSVLFLEGDLRRGEKLAAVCLDRPTGSQRWRKDDYPWLDGVRRMVCHGDLVAFEVSTLADTKEGNALHVVSAVDGRPLWDRSFVPGMNHMKQARAMFIGDTLWVLEDRQCVALDPRTGEAKQQCPAGFCHCFPPVATPRFMLAGEMELTDLASGRIDANRITKAACSRDYGWVPANGLIYVSPKHCVCWPMLRGYTAMAPASAEGDPAKNLDDVRFALETGAEPPPASEPRPDDWPCYRHDAWRSSTTAAEVPAELAVLWTTPLGGWPEGIVAADWREDPFVHGPVTPPVIAGGTVYVARPDAQQVVALDARSGEVRWRFTANGRVDTAPTIYGGLCLFGAKTGWVYAVRADDGRLVWRLRAAPSEEQIVAYGQLESPWPVPGSVLVVDGVAYFAAGRQPLAEGGILVFAVEPASGKIRWVKRLDTVPTENFYGSSGLEFDNFDLLQEEGKCVAMSRWLFDRATGEMTCKGRDVFAVLTPGEGSVVVPRGCWTYAPRHQPRHGGDHSLVRPLAVFSNRTLLGSLEDFRTLYRRDFHLDGGEKFDMTWITGWAASENFNKKEGPVWRCDRLAEGAAWKVPVFAGAGPNQRIAALVLAGETLFAAGSEGELVAVSSRDGKTLARLSDVPSPVWDGMAAAEGRLFVTAQDGRLLCLGRRTGLP